MKQIYMGKKNGWVDIHDLKKNGDEWRHVVYCHDCAYYRTGSCRLGDLALPEEFCSYGIRKDYTKGEDIVCECGNSIFVTFRGTTICGKCKRYYVRVDESCLGIAKVDFEHKTITPCYEIGSTTQCFCGKMVFVKPGETTVCEFCNRHYILGHDGHSIIDITTTYDLLRIMEEQ